MQYYRQMNLSLYSGTHFIIGNKHFWQRIHVYATSAFSV